MIVARSTLIPSLPTRQAGRFLTTISIVTPRGSSKLRVRMWFTLVSREGALGAFSHNISSLQARWHIPGVVGNAILDLFHVLR